MSTTRRHFLQSGATTTMLAAAAPAQIPKGANDKINVACIGFGIMGQGDVSTVTTVPGAKLVAVSDVYEGRLTKAKEVYGKDIFTARDYREVLARPDIDAVIVATPDHWHQIIACDAMRAGKDVYCQKPMVQKVEEGAAVIKAEKETKRILQVGSQRASSILYAKAREVIQQGSIGEVRMVEAYWDRNSPQGAWQYSIPPDATPQTIDWDRFLGHAPKRPFEPIRLFRWRNYQDYGTGVAGDLYVHLFTGIHYVMDSNGPDRIMSTGGLYYWKDGRDVPDLMLGMYDYPDTKTHKAFHLS
ncbi:MAG: Gfo/Idh/MocA family oxidoreductase, partial [Saprospiraceae bacterium]